MIETRLEGSPIVYHISRCPGGKWLMFLHAAFVNHHMFDAQIAYFQEKYNIIAVDILGHGKSTQSQKGDSIAHMSRWMREILIREQVEKVNLLGVSLGAVIVQDFANLYPEMVESLACFGGYDINNFDPRMQKSNSAGQALMMLKAIFSIKWFAGDNKKISAHTEKAQEEFYRMNLEFPKASFMYLASLGTMVNCHKTKPRPYPLLVGCGQHDIPMELEAVRMWAESESDCRKVIFDGAGHCVNMDVPDQFNRTMEEFWV